MHQIKFILNKLHTKAVTELTGKSFRERTFRSHYCGIFSCKSRDAWKIQHFSGTNVQNSLKTQDSNKKFGKCTTTGEYLTQSGGLS